MKQRFFQALSAGLLLAVMGVAQAGTAVTVEGKPACQTYEWLIDYLSLLANEDADQLQAYQDENKCQALEGGKTVPIMTPPGKSGSVVQFSLDGAALWSVIEGLTGYQE